MSDWSDETRARLEARSTLDGTWGAAEDGPWCVKREADIRAALGEIERRGERLAQWEREEVTRAANCCGQEERAEAAEAEVERLTEIKEYAERTHEEMRAKLAEAQVTAEAAQERMRLELVRVDGLARERGEEVERLKAERRELFNERGLLRAAVRKLLAFEASYGEQDIPEEDRMFARAALRGGGEPCTCDRLSTMELADGDKCARCARGGGE